MDAQPEPLSLEEHRELARDLRLAGARMAELCNLIITVYGADSRAAFSFRRAAESIERVRSEMQTQAARDWPESQNDPIYL